MYATAAARNKFMTNQVATASPALLLTMLYDRLVLDLARAEAAQREATPAAANEHLLHAQDIITELLSTLDVSAWEGAPQLSSLYGFMLTELASANVSGDADRTASVRALVEPLQEAWHGAAQQLAGAETSTPTP